MGGRPPPCKYPVKKYMYGARRSSWLISSADSHVHKLEVITGRFARERLVGGRPPPCKNLVKKYGSRPSS